MALTFQWDAVNFVVDKTQNDEGETVAIILRFVDPSGIVQTIIPFDPQSWLNFKRTVAADGALQPIAIARDLSAAGRMDIPKSK